MEGVKFMDEFGRELTGDEIPYHLRLDAPPLGQCNRCHRKTWSPDELGAEDRMTQPDGNPCGGRVVAVEGNPPT
jgi:hypothetical protein